MHTVIGKYRIGVETPSASFVPFYGEQDLRAGSSIVKRFPPGDSPGIPLQRRTPVGLPDPGQHALDGGAHASVPRRSELLVGKWRKNQAAWIHSFRQRRLAAERKDGHLPAERDLLH